MPAERLLANNPRLDPEQARFLATKATRQDEDGRYRFEHVGPGTYTVKVGSDSFRAVTKYGRSARSGP